MTLIISRVNKEIQNGRWDVATISDSAFSPLLPRSRVQRTAQPRGHATSLHLHPLHNQIPSSRTRASYLAVSLMEDYYYMAASPASSPEAEIDNYYIFPSLLSALRDKVRDRILPECIHPRSNSLNFFYTHRRSTSCTMFCLGPTTCTM